MCPCASPNPSPIIRIKSDLPPGRLRGYSERPIAAYRVSINTRWRRMKKVILGNASTSAAAFQGL
jgi:hypothetical protein